MIINKNLIYLIFTFFLFLFSLAIYSDITNITKKISNIKQVNTKLSTLLYLNRVIKELQKERGLTNIYYAASNNTAHKHLLEQRESLDYLLKDNDTLGIQHLIESIRNQVDKKAISQKEIFQDYTNFVFKMLLETKKLLLFINDSSIKNHFIIYQNSNLIQEYLGQLRAEIGSLIEEKKISPQKYNSILEINTLMQNYINQNKENIELLNIHIATPLHDACFIQTNRIIKSILEKKIDTIRVSSLDWFELSTAAINTIDNSMHQYVAKIYNQINAKEQKLSSTLRYHIIFWIFTLAASVILTIILFKTTKNMLIKQRLLEDYKKAIDNSTIVSKTNKKGIITYANRAFCDISGYSLEELVGKPHSIVRHPSMQKAAFKELWETIQSGDTWQGQLPNLAKDGSTYWVDASISPIYDDENNLVEYIAIRHDITQIIELNKEIKNTQYELIYRMGESVESRSKESGYHIQRVAHYSKLLAQLHGLNHQEAETIFIASTMHDVGKIAIADSILLKTEKLNQEEWEIMKTHAAIGYKILAGSKLPLLKVAANIAYEHHEQYNGNGYPRGIEKDAISIHARIVTIADVFDALISQRVYKDAWPLQKVIALFKEERGKQFDPELIDLFLENIDKFMEIKKEFED